jgi:hypothetical protein
LTTEKTTKALIPRGTGQKIDQYFKAGLQRTKAQEVQDPQAFRLSIARRRYREGFTDQSGFIAELEALHVPEDQKVLEIIAGDLEAGYDYTMDLLNTWRTAFRSGQIDVARFAELVSQVVVVPERAQTYVARELARFKPEDLPSLAPVPQAYYETDAGKVAVDTVRRQRRKRVISQADELTALRELGVPEELAKSYVANDDIRLRKGEESD